MGFVLAGTSRRALLDAGLLIGPCGSGGRVIKLIPPLIIEPDDLAEGLDILEAAIAAALEEA